MKKRQSSKRNADKNSKRQKCEDLRSLVEAVKTKRPLDVVQKIIDLGVSLEEKDEYGKTALMYAVINDDIDVATTLIIAGADIRAADSDGLTVFMHAVLNTSFSCDLLESLLVKGADISVKNKSGYTALLLACESGDADLVPVLLSNGASLADKTQQKESALMLATRRGCPKIMTTLISAGADINRRDADKETALFNVQNEQSYFLLLQAGANQSAVSVNGNTILINFVKRSPELLNCIKHLLQNGANLSTMDNHGNTPLTEACKHPFECLDLVKLFLEQGANPSSENRLGLSPLSYAISRQHAETIKLLLSAGANASAHDKQSVSLLMQLCRYDVEFIDIFNLLIEAGANLSAQDKKGLTALMYAIKHGHGNYLKTLLQSGANPSVQGRKGTSALIQACNLDAEMSELVEDLIQAGANTSSQNIHGETALMVAVQRKHYNIVKLLVKHGANVCVQNRCGTNVLMMACKLKDKKTGFKLVKLFLKHGANVSAQDNYGDTALFSAVCYGNCKIAELLIEAGANISIQDGVGYTLLMKACERGLNNIVNLLLKKGASVRPQNNFGETAVVLAAAEGEHDIMFLLLDSGACAAYKNNSVVYQLFQIIINSELEEQDFITTLKRVLDYNSDIDDSSLIVYEMVRSYLDHVSNEESCCWKLALATIKHYVEEVSSKLKSCELSVLKSYPSDIHKLLMGALSTCEQDDGIKFTRVIQLFDIIMKSPFKDVNWSRPVPTCLDHSAFSCINGTFVPSETIGFLMYTCRHELLGIEKLKILQNSLENLINNGFSVNSDDARLISPLTILTSLLTSPIHEKHTFEILKCFFKKGVLKCQRLLRFQDQSLTLLSQHLQLPDALWLAFINCNVTLLPYLLPYWSAPPLALLLFMTPLRPYFGAGPAHMEHLDTFKNRMRIVFPTLVKIGGPLPPGHAFINIIQLYLNNLVALNDNDGDAMALSENFRSLHSDAPPSLKQLCRHVIRGCTNSGDDLPQRLSTLVPPGLHSFLLLMDLS